MNCWLAKYLLLSLVLCSAVSSPAVFAQDSELASPNNCVGDSKDWLAQIKSALDPQSADKSYAQILEKVPHWRDRLIEQLGTAKTEFCKPKNDSAVGESIRKAMNTLEEGVERKYYSQESMERLKGLVLYKAPDAITNVLKKQVAMDGKIGGGFGLVVLLAFFVGLSISAKVKPLDLIVTSEDNRVSLSRLQFWLWFMVVVISWGAVSWANRRLYPVPENLYILMGVNATAAVASSAITATKGFSPRAAKPNFFKDVFLDSRKTLDLPRTQMFVWTIIILVGYLSVLVEHYQQGLPSLPNIPEGLIALMGISHGAYLGTKATEQPVVAAGAKLPVVSVATIAALRRNADPTRKQQIDQVIIGAGYTTWDNFMDGKPSAPTQERIEEILADLKVKGVQ